MNNQATPLEFKLVERTPIDSAALSGAFAGFRDLRETKHSKSAPVGAHCVAEEGKGKPAFCAVKPMPAKRHSGLHFRVSEGFEACKVGQEIFYPFIYPSIKRDMRVCAMSQVHLLRSESIGVLVYKGEESFFTKPVYYMIVTLHDTGIGGETQETLYPLTFEYDENKNNEVYEAIHQRWLTTFIDASRDSIVRGWSDVRENNKPFVVQAEPRKLGSFGYSDKASAIDVEALFPDEPVAAPAPVYPQQVPAFAAAPAPAPPAVPAKEKEQEKEVVVDAPAPAPAPPAIQAKEKEQEKEVVADVQAKENSPVGNEASEALASVGDQQKDVVGDLRNGDLPQQVLAAVPAAAEKEKEKDSSSSSELLALVAPAAAAAPAPAAKKQGTKRKGTAADKRNGVSFGGKRKRKQLKTSA